MTTQYTPGPWSTWNADIYASTKDGFSRIATADGLQSTPANDEKNNDNARLIAAAPELFAIVQAEASLYAGMNADEFVYSTAARIKAMRSIIAKVTGEPDR